MDQEPKPVPSENQTGSLEAPETVVEAPPNNNPVVPAPPPAAAESEVAKPPDTTEPNPPAPDKPNLVSRVFKNIRSMNVYFLIFIFVLIVTAGVTFAVYRKAHPGVKQAVQKTSQAINNSVLDELRNTDVTVGQPQQILTVEANAIFSGSALVHGDFETAGQIRSQGPLSASGANINGTGTFDTVQAKKLQVGDDSQLQGSVNVEGNLSVSGTGNFAGALSANKLNVKSLELGGNLVLSRHLDTAGGTPSKSNGSALGGGGTSSISGTDTAGTITINTGNGPPSGCFITVNFTRAFDAPHVVVTPVGSASGSLNYYVTRSSSRFSLCTSSAPGAHKNFSFDYIVLD